MFTLAISYLTTSNLPGPLLDYYAILLFTASDFASITSHIHNWVLFLLWLHLFILSEVISPLFSSSILDWGVHLSVSYLSIVYVFLMSAMVTADKNSITPPSLFLILEENSPL